jgi:hypothetical protein
VTVPSYLQPNFNYLETPGVVDVAGTITRIIAQAVALGWTNPAPGTVVCVADAAGHSFTLVFTRISATNLEMVYTDSFGRTFTRRCQVPATFVERLYLNTFGLFFDPGNGEGLWGSLMDLTPELPTAHDQWSIGHGFRTAGDADDNTFFTCGAMQLNSASPRVFVPLSITVFFTRGGANMGPNSPYSQAGSRMWFPNIQEGPVSGSTHRVRGRIYQQLFVSTLETAQTEFTVPLDQATTGLFKILAFRQAPGTFPYYFAVRKG